MSDAILSHRERSFTEIFRESWRRAGMPRSFRGYSDERKGEYPTFRSIVNTQRSVARPVRAATATLSGRDLVVFMRTRHSD